MSIRCQRCETVIDTFSKMRKWCAECRKKVAVDQARQRRIVYKVPETVTEITV